jgi:hypothetical protein
LFGEENTPMEQQPNTSGSFDWSSVAPKSVAPNAEHYQLALHEYNAGRSFPEIVTRLQEQGLSSELTPEVTTAVAKDRAFYLYSAGKSRAEVASVLFARGLSRVDAKQIAAAVDQSRERAFASAGMGKWQIRSLVTGGVCLMAGLVLYSLVRLGVMLVPGELVAVLLGAGLLLSAYGGVYVVFRVRSL